jgi:hypothetical protein
MNRYKFWMAMVFGVLLMNTAISGCELGKDGSDDSGGCSADEREAQFEHSYNLYADDDGPPIPETCLESTPEGTFTAVLDKSPIYDQPSSITMSISQGELISINGKPCRPLLPGRLRSDSTYTVRDCEQVYQCGCCMLSFEKGTTVIPPSPTILHTWSIDSHGACEEIWKGHEYNLDPSTWIPLETEPDDPQSSSCTDQGGMTAPSGACLLPCSKSSDCPNGDTCRWGMWCADYCYGGPSECKDGWECRMGLGIGTCDIPCSPSCPATWECEEHSIDDGYFRCLPPNLYGPSSKMCTDCLSGCKGMSSCCSGCGCVCESSCGVCNN